MRNETTMTTTTTTATDPLSKYTPPPPLSWRPEVCVAGKWYPNAVRLRTKAEAKAYAHALFLRRTSCEDWRAIGCNDAPSYCYADGKLTPIDEGENDRRVPRFETD
jgi:hypothetical protein